MSDLPRKIIAVCVDHMANDMQTRIEADTPVFSNAGQRLVLEDLEDYIADHRGDSSAYFQWESKVYYHKHGSADREKWESEDTTLNWGRTTLFCDQVMQVLVIYDGEIEP